MTATAPTARASRIAAAVALVVALTAGCADADEIPLTYDDEFAWRLQGQLDAIRVTGAEIALRDLVSGDWDRVHVFEPPVTREQVESVVGRPVDMGDVYLDHTQFVAFFKDGGVQRVVQLVTVLAAGDFGGDVVLKPAQPNSAVIALVDR